MVTIEEIQAAYYMVAATGVIVAAGFYILNLREQRRNMRLTLETRRISLVNQIGSNLISMDGSWIHFELLNWEWTDFEDFTRKYGRRSNLEACAKRNMLFSAYNNGGVLLRKGLLGAEDLYDAGMQGVIWIWAKYKPIIEEHRSRANGQDSLRDMEYLAGEMMKVKLKRDPSFKLP
jgi:hypothetical protein